MFGIPDKFAIYHISSVENKQAERNTAYIFSKIDTPNWPFTCIYNGLDIDRDSLSFHGKKLLWNLAFTPVLSLILGNCPLSKMELYNYYLFS